MSNADEVRRMLEAPDDRDYTRYTDSSRWAIVIAMRRLAEGEVPDNLLYFNCQGYFSWAEPYCESGGNFFSLG